ncbi:hypothetical protein LEM8419_01893 [Neolewinella maritima]|uniref:Beta-lactamase-related domain-containing protein n=1 Tax=Neolewinella maritima TaxID=1383882 RepID=A0ABM9B0Y1_9BACT|nr:serine hydrolase domain-containing protein [Neolewinella maritima]CAH1000805.1 hypothetical protein LEM8419_01893 [Neolewinella maritima]
MSPAGHQHTFDDRCARLRERVDRCLHSFDIPGISLTCFDGDRTCSIHAGYREAGTTDRITDQTIFAAASLGKPILAYIFLRCLEQGMVALDVPLVEYGDYPEVRHLPGHERVTARMVLSHQSGLPNSQSHEPLRLFQPPTSGFRYSGEGYLWLQFILQGLLDAPLDEIAQQWVFTPLGMQRSSFVWQTDEDYALPHDRLMNAQPKQQYHRASAANSLSTTSTDYARFLQEIIAPRHLSKALAREMVQPQVEVARVGLRRHRVGWGLGFGWQSAGKQGEESWHWGNLGGERSYLIFSPTEARGLVYFANSANGLLCTRQFSDIFLGTPQPGYTWYGFNWRGRYKRWRARLGG